MARLRENGHVTEVVTLMEGAWSCYTDDQYNGGRMIMLRRCASLMVGEWSCYGGCQFNGRENGHVTEVPSLIESSMFMLQWWVI